MGQEIKTLQNMLIAALAANVPADLRVWVSGGDLSELPRDERQADQTHERVRNLLKEVGITEDNTHIEWGNNPDEAMAMVLDSATGECHIVREEAEQEFFDDYDEFDGFSDEF